MVLLGPVRSCMSPYGPVWSCMSPYGPVWSCLVPSGPLLSTIVYSYDWKQTKTETICWPNLLYILHMWNFQISPPDGSAVKVHCISCNFLWQHTDGSAASYIERGIFNLLIGWSEISLFLIVTYFANYVIDRRTNWNKTNLKTWTSWALKSP